MQKCVEMAMPKAMLWSFVCVNTRRRAVERRKASLQKRGIGGKPECCQGRTGSSVEARLDTCLLTDPRVQRTESRSFAFDFDPGEEGKAGT
ncbi:MAG TPA: hypothetical protein VFN35_16475 [Ktedonobacteraceae bacterium]|nr:hypothetical protein [Ktedonobacteraceae bacterium]